MEKTQNCGHQKWLHKTMAKLDGVCFDQVSTSHIYVRNEQMYRGKKEGRREYRQGRKKEMCEHLNIILALYRLQLALSH